MPLAVLQKKLEEVPETYFGEVSDFLDGILAKSRRGDGDEAADDAFCTSLCREYENEKAEDEFVPLEEAAKMLGVAL